MIWSISSSIRRALLAAAPLLVLSCAGGRGNAAALNVTRVALFPVEGAEPGGALAAAIEVAIARAGLDVVSGPAVEIPLAERRLRSPGVGEAAAEFAREELGVEAVLVFTVDRRVEAGQPVLELAARLVQVTDHPRVIWMDGYSGAAGPRGLLGIGGHRTIGDLERDAAGRLSRSVVAFIRRGEQRGRCDPGTHFRPRSYYRLPRLPGRRTVVLPFLNASPIPAAGETMALQLVRQLAASASFDVVDPGAVRDALRKERIITRGGVSLAEAERMAKRLDADLVVSGEVVQYDPAIPAAAFSVVVLDREERVVWRSSSRGAGGDPVSIFDLGRIATIGELACRMAAGVVSGILADEPREATAGERRSIEAGVRRAAVALK